MVESWCSKHKALSSNPSTAKKKEDAGIGSDFLNRSQIAQEIITRTDKWMVGHSGVSL
jgi:hypothetical protein